MALLSAPLLALAQSPIGWAPVALVALVPWLFASRRANGALRAVALGALVGTAYGCMTASWMPEALASLGSSRSTAVLGLVTTAAWAKAPVFAAVGWTTFHLRRSSPLAQIVGIGAALGVGEWVEGTWRLGVPWALVGHSQLEVPGTAQLAVVGGVPLLSAWIGAINASLVLAFERAAPLRVAGALTASWLGLAILGMPLAELVRPPSMGPGVTLLIVQPDLPRYTRWDWAAQPWILQTLAEQTSAALAESSDPVDAVVWPENLLTDPLETNPDLAAALQAQVDRWNVPLITGLVRRARGATPRTYRSSVVRFEPGRGEVGAVDKFRAIPLLESQLPRPLEEIVGPWFGAAAQWPKVEESPRPGPPDAAFEVIPVLCYEALFPRIVARRRNVDSVAILNLADDSWVTGETATVQLTDFARFRAIEQRLPLIRVAHGGLSVSVDEFGRIRTALPIDEAASGAVVVQPSPPATAGERAAILSLPIAVALGVGWLLGAFRRRARSPKGELDVG